MPTFSGFSHIALTVSDVERSKQWYTDVLGWQPLMEGTDDNGIRFAFGVLSGGQVGVGLRQPQDADREPFSYRRTGLDHVSFTVGSRAELDDWERHLADSGVTVSSIVEAPYGSVLSFKDPDGVALEAFAPIAG
jgi:catechol-2,3-dioxygenase